MTQLLCRNRVEDFETWRSIFVSDEQAQGASGLVLKKLWRAVDDPNNVFFLFDVRSIQEAEAFMSTPEAEEAGRASGVLDGECYFVETADLG